MLVSMTGFGKAECKLANKTISIEIKTLNSKHLDLAIKVPQAYKEIEMQMRTIISQRLFRGKVELTLTEEVDADKQTMPINEVVVKKYYDEFNNLSDKFRIPISDDILSVIMRLPDTISTPEVDFNEEDINSINKTLDEAIDNLISFRKQEGSALEQDIKGRVIKIKSLLKQIEPYEKNRVSKIEERIKNNLANTVGLDNVDENRLEQELIYYLEKLDITEEKVRLDNHCDYFIKTTDISEPVGKKLGFISQEIGREINTLGSKANDSDIQKYVILMKDELEKIKEQLLNVL